MLHALLAAGALFASAPLDAAHAAVFDVLSHGADAESCDGAKKRTMASEASIRPLGRVGNDTVVLAEVTDPCICGAQNCPFYAIAFGGGRSRVLRATYGISARNADRARPLPGLVVAAHDSAMVVDETTYAYRNGAYAEVSFARVRQTDHARKPSTVALHFAQGTSSARLRGTASLGWYDAYVFDAARGQRVTVETITPRRALTATLFPPDGAAVALHPGSAFVLPASGAYRLQIEVDSESDVPYALNVTIR